MKKSQESILPQAKSGIHINPDNKGKFNATKKATGKSTEELTHSSNPITKKRAIFAQNAAKWHHQDGGVIPMAMIGAYIPQALPYELIMPHMANGGQPPYGNRYAVVPIGDPNAMTTPHTIDLHSRRAIQSANGQPAYGYNAIDNSGNQKFLMESDIPNQYLGQRNNYGITTQFPNGKQTVDSMYMAPGLNGWDARLPHKAGGGDINSIVDQLEARGQNSSFDARAKMAATLGMKNYSGEAEENMMLLKHLSQQSPLPAPKGSAKNQEPQHIPYVNQPGRRTEDAPQSAPAQPGYTPYFNQPGRRTEEVPARKIADQRRPAPVQQPQPLTGFQNPIMNLDDYNNYGDQRHLQSGVITDKGTNTNHIIENGKVTHSFPILTGKNPNRNDNVGGMKENGIDPMSTPVGSYMLQPNANIYGQPGFDMNPIPAFGQGAPRAENLAQHTTYDPTERAKYYNMSPDQRYRSYGCVNCQNPDISSMVRKFPQGDTAIVINSKNQGDKRFLGKFGKQNGGPIMAWGGDPFDPPVKKPGIQLYPGGVEKTPTGQNNAFTNNDFDLTNQKLVEYAKQYNLPTTSNKDFQAAQLKLLQGTPQGQASLASMDQKFGPTKAGRYDDNLLGARTRYLIDNTPQVPVQQAPPPVVPQQQRREPTGFDGEPMYGPDGHLIGLSRWSSKDAPKSHAQMMYVDRYGKPDYNRGLYEIPASDWSNKVAGGNRRLDPKTDLSQYRQANNPYQQQIGGSIPAQIPEHMMMPHMALGGGMMFADRELPRYWVGDQVQANNTQTTTTFQGPDRESAFEPIPNSPFANPIPFNPIAAAQSNMQKIDENGHQLVTDNPEVVPIKKGKKPGQWVNQNTQQVNDPRAAFALTMGMDMFANQLNKVPEAKIQEMMRQRGSSDSMFNTYKSNLKRGYADPNSKSIVPDQQSPTQFGNQMMPDYYGTGNYMPMMAVGGSMLPSLMADPIQSMPVDPNQGGQSPMGQVPYPADMQNAMKQSLGQGDSYTSIKDFVKKQEGFTKKAQWDYKQYTNGYGTKAKDPNEVLTPGEADARLDQELMPTVDKVKNSIKVPITNSQLTAITSIAYNAGYGVAKKIIKEINNGADSNTIANLIKTTATTVNNGAQVLKGLVNRRKQEAGLYATEEYKEGGEYDLSPAEIARLRAKGYNIQELS